MEQRLDDAVADDLPDPSWIWAWLRGVLVGMFGLVAIGVGLSLILPLPDHLPGVGEVRVVRAEDPGQKTKFDGIPEQTKAQSDDELVEPPLAKPDAGPVRDTGTKSETTAGESPSGTRPVLCTSDGTRPKPDAGTLPTKQASSPARTSKTTQTASTVQDDDPVGRANSLRVADALNLAEAAVPTDRPVFASQETDLLVKHHQSARPGVDDAWPARTVDAPSVQQSFRPKSKPIPKEIMTPLSENWSAETVTRLKLIDEPVHSAEPSKPTASMATLHSADAGAPWRASVRTPVISISQGMPAAPKAKDIPANHSHAGKNDPQIPARVSLRALGSDTDAPDQPVRPKTTLSLAGPAREINARSFEAPISASLLAVVLTDAADGTIPADALAVMTMPLTVSVRPDANAREFSTLARGFGHEVIAELPLSAVGSAQSGDMRVDHAAEALASATMRTMDQMDMAVGVILPSGAPILRDQARVSAIMTPLGKHGFFWLDTRPGGGTRAFANRLKMPWVAADRVIPNDATPLEMYRDLDRAASHARRTGAAIVLVRTTPDALQALVRWGLQNGGGDVWFAPVSAVVARRSR